MSNQPLTLPHTFTLLPLHNHFTKNPLSPESIRLIDLESGTFLDTEEDINVVAAALWMLGARYDELKEGERADDREGLRKWMVKNRGDIIGSLTGKVEPPFTAWTIDQMQKDIGGMIEELLLPTLPNAGEKKGDEKEGGKK